MADAPPPPSHATNRTDFGPRWVHHVQAWCGGPARRRLAQAVLQLDAIRAWERQLARLSEAELRRRGLELRGRARGGEALDRLLPEAFGAVSVVAQRLLGLRPFDVQLIGGLILHRGGLAELRTGEGKTLVAALAAFLNALPGRGVHVATVNDYLARRDAEWLGPLYQALGLTTGVLQAPMEDPERRLAYQCDITYGTAAEFGFDFLRDRLRLRHQPARRRDLLAPWTGSDARGAPVAPFVQRGHHYALVDEADDIFIDEARTPLVIGTGTRPASPEVQAVYAWADRAACSLVSERHFVLDQQRHQLRLTLAGRQQVRWSRPPAAADAPAMDRLYEHVERALHARQRFRRDQHYVVEDDKVLIIDESSGRRMPGRQWSDGLHQAVEAKEQVTVTAGDGDGKGHAAGITFQRFFRLYAKLSGMTGTAAQNWRELRRVYGLRVVCVPTNRPVAREQWPDRVFATEDAKFAAVTAEVQRLHALGRPVLVGTRSIERSEMLSARLHGAGVAHQVLNARYPDQEAAIVAQAGQLGQVTIATNMAGRGTDIRLGPGVAAVGGLHVLGTERHEAIRIDQQLAGRAGRQGDPGSCQFFLSLDDELLEALGPTRQARLRAERGAGAERPGLTGWFQKAQRRLERRHYRQRLDLLAYEKQRQELLQVLGADPYVE